MTAYLLQSALLLGIAYFLGCFLACMARSKLVSPPETHAALSDGHGTTSTAVPIARTPEVTGRPVAPPPTIAPVRQATAQPMPAPVKDAFRRADTIAPVEKPVAAPPAKPASSISPANRFEQALAGAPKPATPPSVPPPMGNPAPVAAKPAMPSPVAPPAPAAPPASSSSAAAAAAAAASVAAAAAAASRVAPPVARAPVSPVSTIPPAVPVAAPPANPPTLVAVEQAKPDDLKRIRSIDALLETSLNKLGIRRYSDIAKWRTEDVTRVSQALGFKGRIEQENWIEQAQILARGEDTHYSRRLARGEQPSARPVGDEGVTKPLIPLVPPAISTAPMRSRSGVEAAAAAAAAMAAAAAASRQPVPPVAAAVAAVAAPTAPATKPEVSDRAAFAYVGNAGGAKPPAAAPAPPQAPPIAIARPAPPVPAVPVPPAAAPVAPSAGPLPPAAPVVLATPATPVVAQTAQPDRTARPVIGSGRDNLQRIGGINSELEKLLNVQGVTRYSQIAHWAKPDIERFDRLFGQTGRVQRENWIEQAQILSKGGDTAYSREHDRRLAEAARREEAAARPARLADAIRGNEARPPEADRGRSSDLSSLRSVRSEAFRPGEAPATTVAGRSEQAAAMAARATGTVVPDDLKRIRGIGVLIEKKLNSMGVTSYTHVANWAAADIERISHVLDFKGRIERENWVEQARILAAGGQTEFSRKTDRDGTS